MYPERSFLNPNPQLVASISFPSSLYNPSIYPIIESIMVAKLFFRKLAQVPEMKKETIKMGYIGTTIIRIHVKDLKSSSYHKESLLFTIFTYLGYLV